MRELADAETTCSVIAGTGDPAFVTDCEGTILAWNGAAKRVLGYTEGEALGHECFALLAGRDIFGNCYCSDHCPLLAMARREEAVSHFQILLQMFSGEMLRLGVSMVVVPENGSAGRSMLHILHPVRETGTVNEPVGEHPWLSDHLGRLTPREIEVLRLLAAGRNTQEIGDLLFVGVATVRSHVQNILQKLEVHSRLEAVASLHQSLQSATRSVSLNW